MNIYDEFIKKQNEIITLVNSKEKAETELDAIKREIYKIHRDRLQKKPTGKTVINDSDYEIVYNRTEKVTLLTNMIIQDDAESSCFVEKITPEKRELKFSKTEYKKLSDNEQEKINKYISKELNKPTMMVKIKND